MTNAEFLADIWRSVLLVFHRHRWIKNERGNMRRCSVCERVEHNQSTGEPAISTRATDQIHALAKDPDRTIMDRRSSG